MPAGLRPLVAAIPDDIARLETPAGAQQAFVQRAAHPLRSPLAVLHTQVAVAARAADLPAKDDALAALRQTVQQAVRLINQLPTRPSAGAQGGPAVTGGASAAQHGHALSGPAVPAVALDLLVRQVPEDVPTLAQAQAIDLGCEKTGSHPVVHNNPMALREMAHNLVDNALRYAPAGGVVTERVQPATHLVRSTRLQASGPPIGLQLQVEDNGPGIAPDRHAAVFQRFFRIDNTRSQGCGLGLPMVAQFSASLAASVSLGTPLGGRGLLVTLRFAAPPNPRTPEPPGGAGLSSPGCGGLIHAAGRQAWGCCGRTGGPAPPVAGGCGCRPPIAGRTRWRGRHAAVRSRPGCRRHGDRCRWRWRRTWFARHGAGAAAPPPDRPAPRDRGKSLICA